MATRAQTGSRRQDGSQSQRARGAWLGLAALVGLAACGGKGADSGAAGGGTAGVHAAQGPYGVTHTVHSLTLGERTVEVSVWAPKDGTGPEGDIVEVVGGAHAADWQALIDAAPEGCPSTRIAAGRDQEVSAAGPFPLVLSSHCHGCTRASKATIAARLASHGIVTAAPDHVGNTLWDEQAGEGLPLNTDTLELRRADIVGVLEAALDGSLGVDIDPERVGALGHSFGSVTVGLVAQTDGRIQAVAGLAAPMENPLLPGVEVAGLDLPVLLLVAEEDNSIGELGNELIRQNADQIPGPVDMVSVADAGHWSLSDLCGLVDAFAPGCGEAPRQTDPEATVQYPDPAVVRAGTATIVTAFFAEQLQGDTGAAARAELPGGFAWSRTEAGAQR